MSIKIDQKVIEILPMGQYPARISKIEPEDGQFGPQLKITFSLAAGKDGEKRTLLGWCSQKFNKKSKLYSWTQAALGGAPIEKDYNFDSDDILSKAVILNVIVESNDKGEYNKILSMLPYKKAKPAPVQAPPLVEAPPPEDPDESPDEFTGEPPDEEF